MDRRPTYDPKKYEALNPQPEDKLKDRVIRAWVTIDILRQRFSEIAETLDANASFPVPSFADAEPLLIGTVLHARHEAFNTHVYVASDLEADLRVFIEILNRYALHEKSVGFHEAAEADPLTVAL